MANQNDKALRERLVAQGVATLTDAELLSLLFDDGSSADDSLELAERVIEIQPLASLSNMAIPQLRQLSSLGIRRAVRTAAAFELGRRARAAESAELTVIRDRNSIVELFEPLLSHLAHEEMWVVYLTSANRIIERRMVAQGGSTGLTTDTKLILKRAVELVAASIIVVHNHPSGTAEPSGEDTALTARLKEAAALFDIALLDHIIIGREGNFSFFASKML